jgi:hypothetical protein
MVVPEMRKRLAALVKAFVSSLAVHGTFSELRKCRTRDYINQIKVHQNEFSNTLLQGSGIFLSVIPGRRCALPSIPNAFRDFIFRGP